MSAKMFCLLIILFCTSTLNAQTPVALSNVVGDTVNFGSGVIWENFIEIGLNSVTSQNFESIADSFDSYAASRFFIMDNIWEITHIIVLGAYFNGTGQASSVNFWFYQDSLGLPGPIFYSESNQIPINGLSTGSFVIQLNSPIILPENNYWFCVQANMDFNSAGQWGWTTNNQSIFGESAWKNPGGGFGTTCNNWQYRIQGCSVGSSPDLTYALLGNFIPVELTSFTAKALTGVIELNWHTATELNNSGFEIERSIIMNPNGIRNLLWENIGFVKGNGTTTEPSDYSFIDRSVTNGKYVYRLKQTDYDGTFEYSNEVEIDFAGVTKFSLEQNYPNPFNPSTKIKFTIPQNPTSSPFTKGGIGDSRGGFVMLKVYDVLGNEIATLVNEEKPAGTYEVEFQSTVGSHNLASGIYYYQLVAGEYLETKKMIILK